MRKGIGVLAIAALAVAGCQEKTNSLGEGEGKVTMSAAEAQKLGKADREGEALRSEDGRTIVTDAGPTESQLGIPFYPNSSPLEKQGFITGNPGGRMMHSKRKTTSPADKVSTWYKEKLKGKIENPAGDGMLLSIKVDAKRSGSIKIEKDGKGALITIVVIEASAEIR